MNPDQIEFDLLLLFHMGNRISTSMVKIIAQMITAESAAVGMKAK